jgi:L-2,4-diaminobutyrate transaminase
VTINIKDISDKDRNAVLHPFTQLKDFATGKLGEPTIVETGKGIRIEDASISDMVERKLQRPSLVRPIALPIITPMPPIRRMNWRSSPTGL